MKSTTIRTILAVHVERFGSAMSLRASVEFVEPDASTGYRHVRPWGTHEVKLAPLGADGLTLHAIPMTPDYAARQPTHFSWSAPQIKLDGVSLYDATLTMNAAKRVMKRWDFIRDHEGADADFAAAVSHFARSVGVTEVYCDGLKSRKPDTFRLMTVADAVDIVRRWCANEIDGTADGVAAQ